MKTQVFLGAIFLMSSPVAVQALPAFHGAEGGGALSVGGRGGEVCAVTSLANSGTGTLRNCVENVGNPRTVVFRVGGTINLTSRLNINNPYTTIAGHTAPGGGIQIRADSFGGDAIYVNGSHVIIRYLTVRKGFFSTEDQSSTIRSRGGSYHIFDHISSYWSNGPNIASWLTSSWGFTQNATIQNSILAEGLRGRSMGTLSGASSSSLALAMTDIDLHKNLFAHNGWRLPYFKNARSRIINNIMYNWWMFSTQLGPGIHADVINNLYKNPAPNNVQQKAEISTFLYDPSINCNDVSYITTRPPSIYAAGNQGPFAGTDNWNMVKRVRCTESGVIYGPLESEYRRSSPLAPVGAPITVIPTEQLEGYLYPIVGNSRRLDCMGNWVNKRDSQDARIVDHAQTNYNPNFTPGRSTWGIRDQNEVGGFPTIAGGTPCQDTDGDGMPDVWEDAMGLNKNDPSDRNTVHSSGYTMLEVYLNGPMEDQPPPPPPPDEELPRIVQTATGFVNDGSAFNLVFGTAPTEGNKLLFVGNISTFGDATREAAITGFATDARHVNDHASMMVLSKTAGASEGATYAVSVTGTVQKHAGILYEIEGANNANFFHALELTSALTSAAVIPTTVGVRPIAALALNLNQTLDPPSGWSNLITVLPINHPLYAVNRAVGTDTTTSYSATWGSGAMPVSALILINPSSFEPPPPARTLIDPNGLRYVP